LLKKEGVAGFFKGLTPKILVVRKFFWLARVVKFNAGGFRLSLLIYY
jgi:hypothetical protein